MIPQSRAWELPRRTNCATDQLNEAGMVLKKSRLTTKCPITHLNLYNPTEREKRRN